MGTRGLGSSVTAPLVRRWSGTSVSRGVRTSEPLPDAVLAGARGEPGMKAGRASVGVAMFQPGGGGSTVEATATARREACREAGAAGIGRGERYDG